MDVDIAWWDEKKNIETVKKKNIKLKFTTNVVLWEMFETVIFYACGSYYSMMKKKKKTDDIDIPGPKVLRECREVSDKKKKKKTSGC